MLRRGPGAVLLVSGLSAFLASAAFCLEPVGVLTEIHTKGGRIEVKSADGEDWQAPKPLLAIRPGDQVRALGTARAVIILAGALPAIVVTQQNSPFVAAAPSQQSLADRATGAVAEVMKGVVGGRVKKYVPAAVSYLSNQQKTDTYASLSVRPVRGLATVIIAPRDTQVLPGSLAFEWIGSDKLRYRVRLLGPEGVIWEQGELERRPLAYPPAASALRPGARYTWELHTNEPRAQRATFDVIAVEDADRVRAALDEVQASQYPSTTSAVLRAAVLMQDSLYADARQQLVAALAVAPEEPALHLLLGHVYDRTGLRQLAADEFNEAEALAAGQ